MKGPKTIYICSECSYKSAKWLGKCPGCGSWNTMEETVEAAAVAPTASPRRRVGLLAADERGAERLSELTVPDFMRTATGMGELDRVLGGGIVSGSVVLLTGEPGIGKSTLLLQISDILCRNRRVLYISGEESRGACRVVAVTWSCRCAGSSAISAAVYSRPYHGIISIFRTSISIRI